MSVRILCWDVGRIESERTPETRDRVNGTDNSFVTSTTHPGFSGSRSSCPSDVEPSLAAVPWQPYLCNLRSEQDAGLGGCLFWFGQAVGAPSQFSRSPCLEAGRGEQDPSFLGGLGRHSQNIDFGSLSHRLVELPLSIVVRAVLG